MFTLTSPPPAVLPRLTGEALDDLRSGRSGAAPWAARANRRLAALSRDDVSVACLGFRVVTNTVRLATSRALGTPFAESSAYDAVLASLGQGRLVATGLLAARTSATTEGDQVQITASDVMVTGVGHADHVLLLGHIDDDPEPTLLCVPTTSVVAVRRPPLRGLHDADNAIISVDHRGPLADVLLSPRAEGPALVEAPYRAGLTFGSVALGGLRALCDAIAVTVPSATEVLGVGLAEAAALTALVEASGAAQGSASVLSRAAKVYGTQAADRTAAAALLVAGPASYATGHPITALAADLAGLGFQAPTNAGSITYLAARPHEVHAAWPLVEGVRP
jgi:alkylation response protein AidB-like acyl-CoA dehydrogenase